MSNLCVHFILEKSAAALTKRTTAATIGFTEKPDRLPMLGFDECVSLVRFGVVTGNSALEELSKHCAVVLSL